MNKTNAIILWIIAFIAYHINKLIIFLDRKFKFKLKFPRDVEALINSRDWCIKTLKEGNHIPSNCEIVEYKVTHLRPGEIFRSDAGIIEIKYKFEGNTSCFKCMAKFSPVLGSIANRAIFNLQQNAQKEVSFYRSVAERLNEKAKVPKSYFADYHALTGNMCILIEFLENYQDNSEIEGCEEGRIAPTVSQMAALHASTWDVKDKECEKVTILPKPVIDFFESLCWMKKWNKTERFILRNSWTQINYAQTIIHGDSRVGNFMYHKSDSQKIQMIDFQAIRMSKGVFDLAYFLILSLNVDHRRKYEDSMIQTYHDCLVQSGVTNYSLDELKEDYKHASIMVLTMLALPWMNVEASTEDSSDGVLLVVFAYGYWENRLRDKLESFDYEWMAKAYGLSIDECKHSIKNILRYFENQYMVLAKNQFESKDLADKKYEEVKLEIENFYLEKGRKLEKLETCRDKVFEYSFDYKDY